MQDFDVLVVGGGIVGLSSAILMTTLGYKVGVIDKNSLNIDDNVSDRVYALNKASLSFLKAHQVLNYLPEDILSYYRKMYVWDEKTGAHIEFSAQLIAEPSLGVIVKEQDLKTALLKRAEEIELKLIANEKVVSIDNTSDGIKIFTNQNNYKAKLLMIADGPLSKVRDMLNVKLTSWSYQQSAIISNVKTVKAHKSCAYQIFTSDGTIAFLPLKDKYTSSIVWCCKQSKAQKLFELDDAEFAQELARSFQYKLEEVTLETKRQCFPLHMRHVKNYVGKNYMFLGDAAHTIHPLAGLGLNLGLSDVSSFAQIIREANNQLPWSSTVLNAYQRERNSSVWKTILLMQTFKQLFMACSPLVLGMRAFGLNLSNESNFLKRLFINFASH